MLNRKKILFRILILVLIIFFLNSFALKLHWYFSVWWSDMSMHLLAGFWVGLVFFWLIPPKNFSFLNIGKIILGVFLVGIIWEIFEILVDKIIAQNPFNFLDTLSDLCFDLAGALLSVFYFLKRILIQEDIHQEERIF